MMTPQAKALEFLFFDLSSCVEPPTAMPQPPIVPPPGTPTQPPPTVGPPARRAAAAASAAAARSRVVAGRGQPGRAAGRGRRRGPPVPASPPAPLRIVSGRQRQREREAGAPLRGRLHPDRAALGLDQALGDVQPEPAPLARGLLGLPETLEDVLAQGRGHAGTCVDDRELRPVRGLLDGQRDRPPAGVNLTAFPSRFDST